jgi:hypothetical protein
VGLSDKKESAMINDLKILLKMFKKEEISPKRFAKVMLEDSILLWASPILGVPSNYGKLSGCPRM